MGQVPINISLPKPVKIHTCSPWIWVSTDTDRDDT